MQVCVLCEFPKRKTVTKMTTETTATATATSTTTHTSAVTVIKTMSYSQQYRSVQVMTSLLLISVTLLLSPSCSSNNFNTIPVIVTAYSTIQLPVGASGSIQLQSASLFTRITTVPTCCSRRYRGLLIKQSYDTKRITSTVLHSSLAPDNDSEHNRMYNNDCDTNMLKENKEQMTQIESNILNNINNMNTVLSTDISKQQQQQQQNEPRRDNEQSSQQQQQSILVQIVSLMNKLIPNRTSIKLPPLLIEDSTVLLYDILLILNLAICISYFIIHRFDTNYIGIAFNEGCLMSISWILSGLYTGAFLNTAINGHQYYKINSDNNNNNNDKNNNDSSNRSDNSNDNNNTKNDSIQGATVLAANTFIIAINIRLLFALIISYIHHRQVGIVISEQIMLYEISFGLLLMTIWRTLHSYYYYSTK